MRNKQQDFGQKEFPVSGCGGECINSLECPYSVCLKEIDNAPSRIARNAQILLAYDNTTLTMKKIAEQHGVTTQTVYNITKENGRSRRKPGKSPLSEST